MVPDSVRVSSCLPGQARRVQAAYFLCSLKRGLWGLTLLTGRRWSGAGWLAIGIGLPGPQEPGL